MPEQQVVEIPFGQGLDRETGVMAVRPGSMEDLRNLYIRQGKYTVRKGVEAKLSFLAEDDATPVTHILAGQSLRGERMGLVVGYQGDPNNPHPGEVYIYRLDADATVQKRVGHWFTVSDPANADPPTIITAESFGMAFFAHDQFRQNDRATTQVFDPFSGEQLRDLTGKFRDTDDDGEYEEEPIAFRGVVAHRDYLWGWGFGDQGTERLEMVRFSKPGAPDEFDRNAYFIPGSRRDPTIACEPAGDTLMVFKETETWVIRGANRDEFGIFRVDERFGCLSPRLSASVAGTAFTWSDDGPRMTEGGPTQSINVPLELKGFEPDTLPARGDLVDGFCAYVPEVQAVIWVFDQRVYALSVRQGAQGWTYWSLGFTPECAFSLYSSGVGSQATTAPPGHPEWLKNGTGTGADEIKPTWKNVDPEGDEKVEIWTRLSNNLLSNWEMDLDEDGDGVADNWPETDSADHTISRSIEDGAQKVDLTGSTAAADSYQEQVVTGIEAGKDYTISPELQTSGFTAGTEAVLEYAWLDTNDAVIGSATEMGPYTGVASFDRRYTYDATAPTGAEKLRIRLIIRTTASGETGTLWWDDMMVVKVEDQEAWKRQDSVPVNPTPGSEQDAIIDGFKGGDFMEVALRYARSVTVTSGYEGDDPDAWPDVSKGVASTPNAGAQLEFEFWFYGETSLSTGHGLHFNILYESGVKQAMADAQAEGKDVGVLVFRKRPGVAGETEFTQIADLDGTPDEYEDDALGEDTSDANEEEYEYKIKTYIGSIKSAFSDVVKQWPGPCGLPDPWDVFVSDDTGGAGIVTIAWENHDSDLDIWGFDYWCSVDNATDRVAADNIIERRNVTDGASFSFHDSEPCGTESHDDDVSGSAQGDELEYRFRHRVRVTDDVFFGPYTTPQSVIVP